METDFEALLAEAVEAEIAWEAAVRRNVDAGQAACDAALARGMTRDAFEAAYATAAARRPPERAADGGE